MPLHILSQPYHHADAFVVGSDSALRALRRACDIALLKGNASLASFTGDGEGFNTFVICLPDKAPQWEQLQLPYTDDIAKDARQVALHPYALLNGDAYRDLSRRAQEEVSE